MGQHAANTHMIDHQSRLLARLIRTVLATPDAAEFTGLADVVAALKQLCARLHIGWTNEAITDAISLVASNTALPGGLAGDIRHALRRREVQPVSRTEAAEILQRLGVRL